MPRVVRTPFEEVITDPLLMKKAWEELSPPQQSALRVFYGLPLDEEGLKHYSVFMNRALFDDLGYVKEAFPALDYDPIEHEEAVVIFGRRSAKTSGFLAFALAYEALFGGHTAWAKSTQEIVSFVVAQKLEIAQAIIRDFVEPIIASSKVMEKQISKSNTDGIELRNGHRIAPAPPIIKAFRYYAIPVVAMDEASFWYKDAESANPDFEVLRAVAPAQAQFPNRKTMVASTVWTKEGIIWEAKNAGNKGVNLPDDDDRKAKYKHTLVLQAPTPAMENPLMTRKWFEREFKRDPEAYKREILNQALDSVSGMFAEFLLRKAIEDAPHKRPFVEGNYYVAAMDPAFRGDDFTFTIGHYEKVAGFVQDFIQKWSPSETKLNPSVILDEIKIYLDEYHIEGTVFSDQYQLESLNQLANDRGFSVSGMDFTSKSKVKMFGSFLQLLRNGRVKLIRNPDQFQQFLWIQKFVREAGFVKISAPPGKHDDLVTVTVLCSAVAIQYEPLRAPEPEHVKTPYEIIMEKFNQPPVYDSEFL